MSSVYTIYNIKDEDFIEIIKTSTTWTEILRKCGYNNLGTNKTIIKRCIKLNIDISHLKQTKDVWFRDAYFVDASGTASFTEQETKDITYILSDLGNLFRTVNALTLNRIATNSIILTQIKTFNNSKIRAGQIITDTTKHVLVVSIQ